MQILDLSFWQEAIRGLGALLCKVIYWLIALLYELFATISRVNILSSDEIAPIYQRVTMIFTIVMVFYITFEFVKYIVQPDTISDKEKGVGNITFKIIIVILLIAFVPTIFSTAYKLQNRLLETQAFSKIILGKEDTDMSSFGKSFSADMFSIFYTVNEEACSDGCEATTIVEFNLERLRREGDLKYLDLGINESAKVTSAATGKKEDIPLIQFDGIEAILVGGFLVYVLLLYCIDVGTRYAQMVFLQLISPIAIMGYLTPKKDNMFSEWAKQCLTTYLSLFIRITIIYFVLLICQILKDAYKADRLFAGLDVSSGMKSFTYIALIMGLLLFANKAPKMLEKLFPTGGAAGIGFGLKANERVAPLAARTAGFVGGSIAGGVTRTASRIGNEAKRRKEIKEKLAEEGKATDRRSVNKALREARKAEKEAKNDYKTARRNLFRLVNDPYATAEAKEKAQKDYKEAKDKYISESSARALAENRSYGSMLGLQGLEAFVSGAFSGGTVGFRATKLEDISKKISESFKNAKENEANRIKYLEEGGGATISASVERTITKLQQAFGVKTTSEILKQEVKTIEDTIKTNKAQSAMEKSLKSAQDSAEDRAKKKIIAKEQNIAVASKEDAAKLKGQINSKHIEILPTETSSAIYTKFEARANSTKAQADAANAELIKRKMDINSTPEEIKRAEEAAAFYNQQQVEAEKEKEDALKYLSHYAITRTQRGDIGKIQIQDKDENGKPKTDENGQPVMVMLSEKEDAVLTSNVNTMEQAAENARRSHKTVEYMESKYASSTKESDKAVFAAFMNGEILDFDTYDTIQGNLTNHASRLTDEISGLEETVRAINESSATDAANANASSSGGNKKK